MMWDPWTVFLIDDRLWRPDPQEGPVWEPNWRVWRWVLGALVMSAGGFVTSGFVSYVCVVLAFACALCAFDRALPYKDGLREHRQ
jgi:hypothetical protein